MTGSVRGALTVWTLGPCPAGGFEALGWTRNSLDHLGGVVDLACLLDSGESPPDLFLQVESLAPRPLVRGLEKLACPRVFWSIDAHLNAWWQAGYARLFDLALSTQQDWAERLGFGWLPWHGHAWEWTPHLERPAGAGFIGRITPERPGRRDFVEFLQNRFQATVWQDTPIDTYRRVRLAPNETILGELNFRIFEAASAGCAILTPPCPGLSELFGPDEVALFHHALDLDDRLRFFLKRPDEAERMGRAAWERTRREHLAHHRIAALIELALAAPRREISDPERALALTAVELGLAGRLAEPAAFDAGLRHLESLEADPKDAEAAATALRARAETGDRPGCLRRLTAEIAAPRFAGNPVYDHAASASALLLNAFDVALLFWRRFVESQKTAGPDPKAPPKNSKDPKPESPVRLHLAWAEALRRAGKRQRAGRGFDFERHVPDSALEHLFAAHGLAPEDMEAVRLLENRLAELRGTERMRAGLLSLLSLRRPGDWRLGARLGLVNLRAFRVQAGIEELSLARESAAREGRLEAFTRLVAAEASAPDSVFQALRPKS